MSGLEIERTHKSFHVLDRTRMIAKCTENWEKKKEKRQNKICKFMTLMPSCKYALGVNSLINDTKKGFFHRRPSHPSACTV